LNLNIAGEYHAYGNPEYEGMKVSKGINTLRGIFILLRWGDDIMSKHSNKDLDVQLKMKNAV